MSFYLSIALAFATSIILTVVVMPFVISLSKKLKLRQTILHYVDNHTSKSGTPTFGGIGFIIVVSLVSILFFNKTNTLAFVCIAVFAGYGIIGFLDDFIKIYFRRNKGLNVVQKIIAQLGLSIILSYYAYSRADVGSFLWIPFFIGIVDIGWLIIPFNILVIVALTNAVNLIDGLDGLASKVSIIFLLGTIGIIFLLIMINQSLTISLLGEYRNILIFCIVLLGGLIGFLSFNAYPAKIFMGDTGALAIGGGLSCVMIFTRLSLFSPLLGIMYTLTALSVLMQVVYYKFTKKRIFLMAPIHHHFERKGIHENIVSVGYTIISLIICVIVLILSMWLGIQH